jgi:hypothetical protein
VNHARLPWNNFGSRSRQSPSLPQGRKRRQTHQENFVTELQYRSSPTKHRARNSKTTCRRVIHGEDVHVQWRDIRPRRPRHRTAPVKFPCFRSVLAQMSSNTAERAILWCCHDTSFGFAHPWRLVHNIEVEAGVACRKRARRVMIFGCSYILQLVAITDCSPFSLSILYPAVHI